MCKTHLWLDAIDVMKKIRPKQKPLKFERAMADFGKAS